MNVIIVVFVVQSKLVPRLEAFRPDLILISAGFDGHEEDVKASELPYDNNIAMYYYDKYYIIIKCKRMPSLRA